MRAAPEAEPLFAVWLEVKPCKLEVLPGKLVVSEVQPVAVDKISDFTEITRVVFAGAT